MKQWVKSALKLLTAAVVSVALLFGMSRITDMVLSRQHQEEARTALDGRLSMEQLEELDTGESESVQRAYRARDAAGGVSGYAIQMQVRGYGGPMTVWVALTADGHRFLGLRVTEQQETENLGSRVTESAFADQFAGRAAPIYLDGYTGIDTAATSPEDSGAAEPWKNGTYRAEKTGYDQGYRAFVEITVTDGRITAVNWDAEKQDSDLTKKQESENGTYIMTEDGLRWHEQAAVMEAALMQTQDPAKLIYDQDNGKTDAYAGVSLDISDFVRLSAQALEQAKNGENVGEQEPEKESDNDVDAVSGATVSSKAVVKAANLAYEFVQKLTNGAA